MPALLSSPGRRQAQDWFPKKTGIPLLQEGLAQLVGDQKSQVSLRTGIYMPQGHPLAISSYVIQMLQDFLPPGQPFSASWREHALGALPRANPDQGLQPRQKTRHLLPFGPQLCLMSCPGEQGRKPRPHLPHCPAPAPGEPRSSRFEIHEGVVNSYIPCNPAEYFPGYLTKLLQNHTAYACDGDHLNLQCPRHSTISVQSAFYGQDYQKCSPQQPASQREDSLTCAVPTTLQVLPFLRCSKMTNGFLFLCLCLSVPLSVYIFVISQFTPSKPDP